MGEESERGKREREREREEREREREEREREREERESVCVYENRGLWRKSLLPHQISKNLKKNSY
jgi:hypothetical protein